MFSTQFLLLIGAPVIWVALIIFSLIANQLSFSSSISRILVAFCSVFIFLVWSLNLTIYGIQSFEEYVDVGLRAVARNNSHDAVRYAKSEVNKEIKAIAASLDNWPSSTFQYDTRKLYTKINSKVNQNNEEIDIIKRKMINFEELIKNKGDSVQSYTELQSQIKTLRMLLLEQRRYAERDIERIEWMVEAGIISLGGIIITIFVSWTIGAFRSFA